MNFIANKFSKYLFLFLILTKKRSSVPIVGAFTPIVVRTKFESSSVNNNNFCLRESINNKENENKFSIPSWVELTKSFSPTTRLGMLTECPKSIDSVLDPSVPDFLLPDNENNEYPTLFRERHGWCPYSERVWLVFEYLIDQKKLKSYNTVRIDNTGGGPQPTYYGGGTTPQVRWPKQTTNQRESMNIIYELDKVYNDYELCSNHPKILEIIQTLPRIFPSNARPSSRAAYLFQYNGEPLTKKTFEITLEKMENLLAEYRVIDNKQTNDGGVVVPGPFLGGMNQPTVADIAYVPFLERYRYQLPCLHENLEPYNALQYPCLTKWFDAMEQSIPSYTCRVKGNGSSWRKVLGMAGYGNMGSVPDQIITNMKSRIIVELQEDMDILKGNQSMELWKMYQGGARSEYVGSTPALETAMIITRNRIGLVKDAFKQKQLYRTKYPTLPETEIELDEAFRTIVQILLKFDEIYDNKNTSSSFFNHWNVDQITKNTNNNNNRNNVGAVANFLNERMCIPRDMGFINAAILNMIAN